MNFLGYVLLHVSLAGNPEAPVTVEQYVPDLTYTECQELRTEIVKAPRAFDEKVHAVECLLRTGEIDE